MNIILVIVDSLRQDHVGTYGNTWIHTPNLDSFARDSMVYTRCYSDSMPTLQARRALHTGIRCYPFHDFADPSKFAKGDFFPSPGWGSIPEDQDTLAEIFRKNGYVSGFITDCYHQFKSSRNYHRGFSSWEWIRGQEMDPFKVGPTLRDETIMRHVNQASRDHKGLIEFLNRYKQNNYQRVLEEDYSPARVFRAASRWLHEAEDAKQFFLVIDSFDPHEPWDPPVYYRRIYDPDDDGVPDVIQSPYYEWRACFTERELKRLQANYAGNVTLFDSWFGYFMEALKHAGQYENSIVALISDHGHNLGYDPGDKGLVSKQAHPMTHGVADLVMMLRHPSGEGAGNRYDGLCYNFDLSYTLLKLAGIEPPESLQGRDIWNAAINGKPMRQHITAAWGTCVLVLKNNWWYNSNVWGEGRHLYDLNTDYQLENNLANKKEQLCEELLGLAIEDAGGRVPDHLALFKQRPGCYLDKFDVEPFASVKRLAAF